MTVVAEANDAIEAITLIKEHLPDIVLLDLRMPRKDGHTLTPLHCSVWRGRSPPISVARPLHPRGLRLEAAQLPLRHSSRLTQPLAERVVHVRLTNRGWRSLLHLHKERTSIWPKDSIRLHRQ